MGNLGRAIALAGAAVGGYAKGAQMYDEEQRRKQDQAAQNDERELRMRTARRAEADQIALRAAAAPVQDAAGGVTAPLDADNRDVGQADGPTVANGQLRLGTAAQANTPEARATRMADTLTAQGRPDAAITLQRQQAALTKEQEERVRQIKTEGYQDTMRAMMTGDPDAVAQAFNKTGSMKIEGPLKVAPREIDVPGLGKVQSFDYTGTLVRADGSKSQGTINSHQFAMSLLPYKDHLEVLGKAGERDSKAQLRLAQGEAQVARGEAAVARAEAAATRAGNAGNSMSVRELSEERKQATSLMDSSSRGIAETQRAIAALRKNAILIKPGSPDALELDNLQGQLQRHQAAYDESRQRLSELRGSRAAPAPAVPTATPVSAPGSGGTGKPTTGGAAKPSGNQQNRARPATKAEYDALPPGTTYWHPGKQEWLVKGGSK
jgi:hypothetical protein